MRKQMILLDLDSLEKVLNDKSVRAVLSNAGIKLFNQSTVRELASQIALSAYQYAVPEKFIEIGLGTGDKRKKIATSGKLSRYEIKWLQDLIIECRCDPALPFKQSRDYTKPFESGTKQYEQLIKLGIQLNEVFSEVAQGKIARNKKEFYHLYLKIAFSRVRNKSKFNMNSVTDDAVRAETLSVLSAYHDVLNDEKPWLTQAVYDQYCIQFERKNVSHILNDKENLHKFYLAGKLLLESRKDSIDNSKKAILKVVPVWVSAQKQALYQSTETAGISVELGWLCGPRAIERYENFKQEIRKVLEGEKIDLKSVLLTANKL